ncbi:MAG: hypothetical protein NWT08_04065 [Akkermansiaceae bacterium]|jgi:hypothetical protein|nr:hypothetical protein [Akkermansiaceae bacterium]MDP4646753.1 hypothetical protein [Akkermansiaceae bacterium]MDP4720656.1 hypothetical protein [Akkermansiaceae bacterium]MDP4779670.1 hypothetical protein [Akkermansiaceae bacterium]MDP4846672.1 hypothetical protein [Akkermansiaceae bacterium]
MKLLLAALVCMCLNSCVILVGLDPAEKLATKIEKQAVKLEGSEDSSLTFDFTPDAKRKRPGSCECDPVRIEFVTKGASDGHSVLLVDGWFRTTYHNRFVTVGEPLEATKPSREAFQLTLEKLSGGVRLVELK